MASSFLARSITVALSVSAALFCSACSNSVPAKAHVDDNKQALSEKATPAPVEKPKEDPALAAYNKVLDNVTQYDFKLPEGFGISESANYSYALAHVDGQKYPYLLVKRPAQEYIENVRIFALDSETTELMAPDDVLLLGAASAGGYRGNLFLSNTNPHLELMTTMSGTGATDINEITVNSGALVQRLLDSGRYDLLPERDNSDLKWTDTSDRSVLKAEIAKSQDS